MAFEFTDFYRSYNPRGEQRALFNVARSDEDSEMERYYAFINNSGSYVIQQITTNGTLTNKIYKYYATKNNSTFDTNWTNRASLTYVEYNNLILR